MDHEHLALVQAQFPMARHEVGHSEEGVQSCPTAADARILRIRHCKHQRVRRQHALLHTPPELAGDGVRLPPCRCSDYHHEGRAVIALTLAAVAPAAHMLLQRTRRHVMVRTTFCDGLGWCAGGGGCPVSSARTLACSRSRGDWAVSQAVGSLPSERMCGTVAAGLGLGGWRGHKAAARTCSHPSNSSSVIATSGTAVRLIATTASKAAASSVS